MNFHCAEATGRLTVAALDTEVRVDGEGASDFAGDGIGRTLAGAGRAPDTLVFIDGIGDEVTALAGGAVVAINVSFKLIPEIPNGGENRVGRCLAETAKGAVFNGVA